MLVATDIAARGIDIEAVSHVINFDCPHIADDYIHRVGRTGRAELTGDAFTFVSPEEEANLRTIERAVGKRLPRVTLPGFDYGEPAGGALGGADCGADRGDSGAKGSGAFPAGFATMGGGGGGQGGQGGQGRPAQAGHSGQSGRYQGQGKKKHFGQGAVPRHEGGGWGRKPGTGR